MAWTIHPPTVADLAQTALLFERRGEYAHADAAIRRAARRYSETGADGAMLAKALHKIEQRDFVDEMMDRRINPPRRLAR